MKYLILLIAFFVPGFLSADTGLDFSNDALFPGHRDRWLSNEVRLYHGPYALGMSMFTPTDKRSAEIPYGDRQYDGYSHLEYTIPFKEERTIKVRAGALGAASFQDKLQKFVHEDLDMGVKPQGWHTMNQSQAALDILYDHKFTHLFDSWLGTVRAETSYGARAGNVVDSVFLQNDVRKGWFSHPWQLYVMAGIRGEGVAFNTTIDGRMFTDDIYTTKRVPFVATT